METKRTFKYFSIFQHEQEQDYLREMHRAGWKFAKVSGFCVYSFEKCAPEDVIYQLDYNKHGIQHKDEYVMMFNDCGWEYLQDYLGYSYFRKPASEPTGNEGIFCDMESKLEMLERVGKGRILPLAILFLCVVMPQFIHSIVDSSCLSAIVSGASFCVYVLLFAVFVLQYWKLKQRK